MLCPQNDVKMVNTFMKNDAILIQTWFIKLFTFCTQDETPPFSQLKFDLMGYLTHLVTFPDILVCIQLSK